MDILFNTLFISGYHRGHYKYPLWIKERGAFCLIEFRASWFRLGEKQDDFLKKSHWDTLAGINTFFLYHWFLKFSTIPLSRPDLDEWILSWRISSAVWWLLFHYRIWVLETNGKWAIGYLGHWVKHSALLAKWPIAVKLIPGLQAAVWVHAVWKLQ